MIVLVVAALCALARAQTPVSPLISDWSSSASNGGISRHVIGGIPATAGMFPWEVSINITKPTGVIFCAGSLIHRNFVLTAAHCTVNGTQFSIRIGSLRSDVGGVVMVSTIAVAHGAYNFTTHNNNIAVIQLPSAVTLSASVQVIKILPRSSSCNDAMMQLQLAGWGKTSNGATENSRTLMVTTLTEITNLQCVNAFSVNVVPPTNLCAVGAAPVNASACFGDGGSPLVQPGTTPYLVGMSIFVTSYSCSTGRPSGYTRVAAYHDWLTRLTGVTY